jgi:DNA modification methylase
MVHRANRHDLHDSLYEWSRQPVKTNVLYYGDNLDILRRDPPWIEPASIDLVYLDPPFNSNAAYSVIFKDETGRKFDAQIEAFEDTWHWGPDAEGKYLYLTNGAFHHGRVPSPVSALIGAFHAGIKPSPMLAYLVEMTVRLVELHRVLKPTGSIYLHCDPTASHYLKLVLDALFGARNFRNEIVWKRTSSHNDSVRFGRVHDVILFYGKSERPTFNVQRTPLDKAYVDKVYRLTDENGRRYRLDNISAPGGRGPVYEWGGITQAWRYTKEHMEELYEQGRIKLYPDGRAMINAYVRYLDESEGQPVQDWWDDIGVIAAPAHERLGYPTQKPLALLERIIEASSNPGDIVLDPFCGCGTALVAAQKLGRQWIGIDITYLAIAVMRDRLMKSFNLPDVLVEGRPTEVEGARQFAKRDPYQFQWWAIDLVGAMPQGDPKKGGDKGIDGVISFTGAGWKAETCIVSVKSGGVNPGFIDQLRGAVDKHAAAMGLFVCLDEPTQGMKAAAAAAGNYHSEISGKDYPKIQIITIRELLEEGKKPNLPLLVMPAYQQAQPIKQAAQQSELFG